MNTYAGIRLKEALYLAIAKQLRLMEAEIATLIYQLDNLSRSLGLLKERLQETDEPAADGEEESRSPVETAAARYQQMIVEQLAHRRDDIARKVEQAIDQQLVRGGHGLRRFLEPDSELWKTLSGPLTDASRRTVLDCLKETVCRLMQGPQATPGAVGGEDLVDVILQGLASTEAAPESGAVGRILIVPADVDAAALRERLGFRRGECRDRQRPYLRCRPVHDSQRRAVEPVRHRNDRRPRRLPTTGPPPPHADRCPVESDLRAEARSLPAGRASPGAGACDTDVDYRAPQADAGRNADGLEDGREQPLTGVICLKQDTRGGFKRAA